MRSPQVASWTRLVGPLSPAESAAVLAAGGVTAALVGGRTARRSGLVRGGIMAAVAADLAGGLMTFQLRPTREQYGASSLRSRLTFALVHVQPFVLPAIGQGSWRRAAFRYAAAVGSTVAVELLPSRASSRRRRANTLGVTVSLLDVVSADSPQRWFGPVYLMKVIGGHGGIPPRDLLRGRCPPC